MLAQAFRPLTGTKRLIELRSLLPEPANASAAAPARSQATANKAVLRDFLAVPHRIYRDDPHWVAPLDIERRQALGPGNPFFEHAHWQAWVAYRNGQPIGRISAQIDHLHRQHQGDHAGYFGMLEADDDQRLVQTLIEAAEQWLRDESVERIVGPLNLGMNQELGLLTEGFESPPYFMMPHGRRYYAQALENCGYRAVQTMYAYLIPPDFQAPAVMQRVLTSQAGRIRLRPLVRRQLRTEMRTLCAIFNDAWAENWGFVPFTDAEFEALGSELALLLPSEYIQIAYYDDEPAAFIVMLPNINEAIADLHGKLLPLGWLKVLWRLKVRHPRTARVPLMGVRQKFQRGRTGTALAFAVIDKVRKAAARRGVQAVEMSWILETNTGMRSLATAIGGTISKQYKMFEKRL